MVGLQTISRTPLLLLVTPNPQTGDPIVVGDGLMLSKATAPANFPTLQNRSCKLKPLVIRARGNAKTESAKIRNRRTQKKYNGSPTRPRLSVFCSEKQLYAMLIDDQNKKCLFYGSTLQKSMRGDPTCSTIEAAQRVGEELVKECENLNIHEISSYDRNGFAHGEKMQAFEIAISRFGFLHR